MNRTQEVAAIKRLTKEIEAHESSTESIKWERAERLHHLHADGMPQREIADAVGLERKAIRLAIGVWAAFGDVRASSRPPYAEAYYSVRGSTGNESNAPRRRLTYPEKVDLVLEMIADPVVRTAVAAAIAEPAPPQTARGKARRSLVEEWESWLTRLNSLLTDGAELADRSDGADLTAYAASARMFYDRITERQLDAEIRSFFEEVEA